MTYKIISTGSKGNAVLLGGFLLIDCGVPFKALAAYYKDLKLVLLTHEHGDHINKATVKRLASERPRLRFGCCAWMLAQLEGLVPPRQIDLLSCDTWYDYGACKISPFGLLHNVPNCGYRLDFSGFKLFYATDTGSLEGIEARDYDLYMVEANHGRDELAQRVQEKLARGEFAYELSAAENHLSIEQAEDFVYQNIGACGAYVFLHQHEDK